MMNQHKVAAVLAEQLAASKTVEERWRVFDIIVALAGLVRGPFYDHNCFYVEAGLEPGGFLRPFEATKIQIDATAHPHRSASPLRSLRRAPLDRGRGRTSSGSST